MQNRFLLIFLTAFTNCFAQDSIRISKVDTLLPFSGNLSIQSHGYENRAVPFGSITPLYVLISYKDSKTKHFEYFRIDSSKYLRYQFFRSDKGSSNEGLKSKGIVVATDKIIDSSTTGVIHIGSPEGYGTRQIHYYKDFLKEGAWEEYEDSLFFHKFWTGSYKNNKKVGVWSNYVYDPSDDRLIMQVNYDADPTLQIFSVNLAGRLSIDSIRYFLNGRWALGCEDDKDRRMLISKCQLYDGNYGDDCNNRFGDVNYYQFLSNSKFTRHKGETCNKFKESSTSGQWSVSRNKDDLILTIKLTTGYSISYKVLYLDREGNMVADRK